MTVRHRCSGMTMLEMMITTAILVPVLIAVVSMSGTVSSSISETESASASMEKLRVGTRRLVELIRPSSYASLLTFDAGAKQNTFPVEKVSYDRLTFQLVDGVPARDQVRLTPPRSLRFILDPKEVADGKDTDGDGLVDEGVLLLFTPTTRTPLISGVERFSVTRIGRTLNVVLNLALRDKKGRIHRLSSQEVIYLRNN